VREHQISRTYQDHYGIWLNGRLSGRTYFGESAHHDVARSYYDLVGWQNTLSGDEL